MNVPLRWLCVATMTITLLVGRVMAQDDVASQDLRADKDEKKQYFLITPDAKADTPKTGFGLILVLPGGDGSADFLPFVKRVYKHGVPPGYCLAQLVAVKWTDNQEIVWPTAKNRLPKAKFSTEEFLESVVKDVEGRQKIDPERVFTLTWSSSGPAAYAASLTSKRITGSFVAMSVFRPELLPTLKPAKGHAYFLYHSPDDRVCPYRMAERAVKDLETNGAKVKLQKYEGGHGWRGGLYDDICDGLQWLEQNRAPREK